MFPIEPFDVILFKGNDIISNTISTVEKSARGNGDVTHVEIVVDRRSLPMRPGLKDGVLYLLGSELTIGAPSGEKNIEGVGKFGVQIRELEETLKSYTSVEGARVYWCKNIKNLYLEDRDRAVEVMDKLYSKYHGRGYDWNPLNLLSAAYSWLIPMRVLLDQIELTGSRILSRIGLMREITLEDIRLRRVFCSKFVAIIAIEMGFMDSSINPEDVIPVDFYLETTSSLWLDKPREITERDGVSLREMEEMEEREECPFGGAIDWNLRSS